MRVALAITASLLAIAICPAQQQEQTLMDRLESSQKRWNAGMSSPMNGKAFEGNGDLQIKGSKEQKNAYKFDKQKFGAESYTTRSFFGLKNPWFGKKVMKTEAAGLWSKSLMSTDKKFAVETAKTEQFVQAKKTVNTANEVVEKKTYIPDPKAQGALDQTKPQLTIDEVRQILNKNR